MDRLPLLLLPWLITLPATAQDYDPLQLPPGQAERLERIVLDADRDREIPLQIYLPPPAATTGRPLPVILFSHGLGGSNKGNSFLGEHWAKRGYVAVFLQHPGSDEAIWKDAPPARRAAAMRAAAGLENFLLRAADVPATLDQLELWTAGEDDALSGQLDLGRVGMSGHSFGAITTQAVSGQRDPLGQPRFTDPRIKAAIALSPSAPTAGSPARAFGSVELPWLLMTGTEDIAELAGLRIGAADVASRLAVYPALPEGDKYELVFEGGTHYAFTDHALPRRERPRNPNHHRVILALSTAFWDAYLRQDPKALAWLRGEAPLTLLEQGDRWQTK